MSRLEHGVALQDPSDPDIRAKWHAESKRRMAAIDALPGEWRALVHEYGWDPVKLLRDLGVKSAGQCEHIIRSIRGLAQTDTVLQRYRAGLLSERSN